MGRSLKSVATLALAKAGKVGATVAGNSKGRNAQIMGADFEDRVQELFLSKGIHIKRVPNGARPIPGGRIIRTKSPFDFIAAKSGKCLMFDAKTRGDDRFPFSAIDQNQVKSLEEFSLAGVSAGYVVEFRKTNRILFFPVETLKRIKPHESLSDTDGTLLDSFGIQAVFTKRV